jgi:RNA polymerase sigma factor FliA
VDKRAITPQMQAWIDQSQGMIRSIATKIASQLPASVNYDDLVSYGQLGLMQAVYSFQPDKNVAFQTFAYHRIRGSIYDGLGKMSWTSRAISARLRAEKLSSELLEQQIESNRRAEAAESLSADADWVFRTTERIAVVHLLTDTSDEGKGLHVAAVDPESTPDEQAAQQELCSLLRTHVEQLPDAERELIQLTYFEGKTLTEAAEGMGKSKSWASRVHARVLEKLARCLAVDRGGD